MTLILKSFHLGILPAAVAAILFVLPVDSTLADKPAGGLAKVSFPKNAPVQKGRGGASQSRGAGSQARGGGSQVRGGGSPSRGGNSFSRGGGSQSRGGNSSSRGGGSQSRGGSSISRGGSPARGGGSHQNYSRQFPKTTGLSPNYRKSYGGGSHSYGHSGNSHRPNYDYQQHSGYQRKNYGNYNNHRYNNYYRGGNLFYGSPYGLAFGYSNGNFGFGVSSARYYRPNYGYYGSPSYNFYDYQPPYYSYPSYDSTIYGYGNSSYYAPGLVQPYSGTDRLAVEQLMSDDAIAPAVPQTASIFPIIGTTEVATQLQLRAEGAFREGSYREAAELADQAIALDKSNGMLYLFTSQAEFAVGNFSQAVADLESATELLPSDQWKFVVKNYRSFYGKNDYVSQMERLSDQIAQRPTDFELRTLRGYHYGALVYPDAATKDFQQALAIKPGDRLTKRLMPVLGNSAAPAVLSPEVEGPVPPGTGPKPEELPEPGVLEEIQAPPSMLRLIPESETVAPELTGPSR